MSDPLVSIIMPLYNKEKYIAESLQSALDQTYPNIEIIVVDDGSTDNSPTIARQIAAEIPRVQVITQPNAGLAGARNRGLSTAKGEFVNFLDADDKLHSTFIEKTIAYFQGHPHVDIVHTSWEWIDDQGHKIGTVIAPDSEDYLRDLLLGNMFAVHALLCRRSVIEQAGRFRRVGFGTEDWACWITCAKNGAVFARLPEVLAVTREAVGSMRKQAQDPFLRFLPTIEEAFDDTLPPTYARLKDLSIIRHRFFLMADFLNWGLKQEAREQYEVALALLREKKIADSNDLRYLRQFLPQMTLEQAARFSKALANNGATGQAVKMGLWRLAYSRLGRATHLLFKQGFRGMYSTMRRLIAQADSRLSPLRRFTGLTNDPLQETITTGDIRDRTLDYLSRMRMVRGSEFVGYRHSVSTTRPILYGTLAALLTKHLYGIQDEHTAEELALVQRFQSDDGLFRDPVIACKLAETEDSWGWRHLTLHALMALALYGIPAHKEIRYLDRFKDKDGFRAYLDSRDWGARAAWTSNELQNVGVMLQYARDYQNSPTADGLLEVLYDVLDARQDPQTGLYGHRFKTPMELSLGVQAGYHFWLLYFYDGRPIRHVEHIIDSILKTQNILGGYGVQWNSSACEDIDSIDPLVRFSRLTNYRRDEVQASLHRALPAILHNLNSDGGWVFRRHEALTVVHPQMFSAANESNLFYTWFRTLGLAYCLRGLDAVPAELDHDWHFQRAPGCQFL